MLGGVAGPKINNTLKIIDNRNINNNNKERSTEERKQS